MPGSSSDGLEAGGVAPALGAEESKVLDAVHASNHPPRPGDFGRSGRGASGGGLEPESAGSSFGGSSSLRGIGSVEALTAGGAPQGATLLIARRRAALRRCYQRALGADPSVGGRLEVEVTLDAEGRVVAVKGTPQQGATLPAELVACIEKALLDGEGPKGAPGTSTAAVTLVRP